jgi:hypothetical protein
MFHTGTVVPAPVEKNNLTFRREMGHIALKVPLGLFTLRGYAQGDHTADSWIQPLGDSLDNSSLSGGITAFENDYNAKIPGFYPLVKFYKLELQVLQFFEI